jgi:hypothetical protein
MEDENVIKIKVKKENKNEKLKLEIAELIGQLKTAQITISGENHQAIVNAPSLIDFLKRVLEEL